MRDFSPTFIGTPTIGKWARYEKRPLHPELKENAERALALVTVSQEEIERIVREMPESHPRRGIGLAEFTGGTGLAVLLGYRLLIGMPSPWVPAFLAGSVALAGGAILLSGLFHRSPAPPTIEPAARSPALSAA